MTRYFARLICHRLSGDEDIYESEFNTENDIKQWAEKHSYRDVLTGILVEWTPCFVYDNEKKKDITSKFN